MSAILLDGSGENGFTAGDGVDYGCAGRGVYDAFEHTLGEGEALLGLFVCSKSEINIKIK